MVMEGHEVPEYVYFHRPSRTAIITDLLFWVDPKQTKGWMYRKMLKAIDIHKDKCGCIADMRKATEKAGLQAECNKAAKELLAKHPARLCLTHGMPCAENAP